MTRKLKRNYKSEFRPSIKISFSLFLLWGRFLFPPLLQARVVVPGYPETEVESGSSSVNSEEASLGHAEEKDIPGPPVPGSPFYTSPDAQYVPFTTYPGHIMPRQLFASSPTYSSSNKTPSSSNTSPSSEVKSYIDSDPTCSSPVSSISISILGSPVTSSSTTLSSPYCQVSPRLAIPPSPSPPPYPTSPMTSRTTVASIHM